jgi:hypothetical protein
MLRPGSPRVAVPIGDDDREEARERLTEVGIGITLCGVIANMGLTIGLGVTAPLAVRLVLAFVVPVAFIVALAVASRKLRLLSRLPWWMTRAGRDPAERLLSEDD